MDMALVLLFGLVAYGMRLSKYEPAPLLTRFILDPIIEESFSRSLLLSAEMTCSL